MTCTRQEQEPKNGLKVFVYQILILWSLHNYIEGISTCVLLEGLKGAQMLNDCRNELATSYVLEILESFIIYRRVAFVCVLQYSVSYKNNAKLKCEVMLMHE